MQSVGRYRVQEEIGRGANGVVYRAWDPERKEDVAVKVLTETDPKKRARFQTEVRTLARLRHPNLVTVLAYGEHRGHPFLVMEFVRGGALQDEVSKGGMPVARAVEVAHGLAQAVAYAHSCSVIHRDIKPDNVLLTPAGEPKLTDFGLARDLDATHARLTQSRATMGTPGYWAPEQAGGKREQISELTDVYGLGATLYAMLTGAPPIQGRGYLELVQRTLSDPPIAPSRLVPDVWPALDALCLKALAKDPTQRFPSVTNFSRSLHACLRAPRKQARPKGPALVVAAVVVLVGLGVGLTWVLGGGDVELPVDEVSEVEQNPLIEHGTRAYEAQDFAALRTIANQLLQEDPDLALARLWRGAVRCEREDWEAARTDLTAAYDSEPTRTRASLELARVSLGQGDFHAAEDWARRALSREPEHPLGSWLLAHALLKLERVEEAADVLEAPSNRAGPKQFALCMLRSEVLMNLQRNAEAERALLLAAEANPDEPNVHRLMAGLLVRTRRFEDAKQAYARAIEVAERPAVFLADRAQFRIRIGDLGGAHEDASRAQKLEPEEPTPLVALAHVLHAQENFDKALQCVEAALQLDPNDPGALFAGAQFLYARMEIPPAMRLVNKLVELQPAEIGPLFLRSSIARELGDWNLAVRDCRQVIELEQGRDALSFSTLGTLFRESGRLNEALVNYDQALALRPSLGSAHYGRGLCLMFVAGRREEALSELRQGLADMPRVAEVQKHWVEYLANLPPERDPFSAGEWIQQGQGLFQQENLQLAAVCFLHALELGANGRRQETIYNLGKCYGVMGLMQQAEQEFSRALWMHGEAEIFISRALARTRLENPAGALSDFSSALQLNPQNALALRGRAAIFANAEDYSRALADLALYVQLKPLETDGWGMLAEAAFQAKEFEGAVQAASRFLQLSPQNLGMLELRGTALLLQDRFDEAVRDFSGVLERDPGLAEVRTKRMVCLNNLQRYEEAVRDTRHLLAGAPDDPRYLTALAQQLEQLGQVSEAVELYRRALRQIEPGSQDYLDVQAALDTLQGKSANPGGRE